MKNEIMMHLTGVQYASTLLERMTMTFKYAPYTTEITMTMVIFIICVIGMAAMSPNPQRDIIVLPVGVLIVLLTVAYIFTLMSTTGTGRYVSESVAIVKAEHVEVEEFPEKGHDGVRLTLDDGRTVDVLLKKEGFTGIRPDTQYRLTGKRRVIRDGAPKETPAAGMAVMLEEVK